MRLPTRRREKPCFLHLLLDAGLRCGCRRGEEKKVVLDMSKARRITFSLLEEEYQALEKLAEQRGMSLTDTLRDAIIEKQYFNEARGGGSKVLLEKPDGTFREVVFR
jgi:Ribbon-helix-helix protein, copG family